MKIIKNLVSLAKYNNNLYEHKLSSYEIFFRLQENNEVDGFVVRKHYGVV